jgi:hypothetical protein
VKGESHETETQECIGIGCIDPGAFSLLRSSGGRPAGQRAELSLPTAAGRRGFFDWLRGSAFEEDEVTYDFFLGHPFLAKCMFFKHLSGEEVRAKLAAQAASAAAKLESFRAIREGMVERGADPMRIAILELGMAQQLEKVRWLEDLSKDMDRTLAQATGGEDV